MRKVGIALASLLVLSAAPRTPDSPLAPLVEKITVPVTNVDATVTDRNGNPITGLTQNDFTVYEDGVAQIITNFYVIQNGAVRQAAAAPAAGHGAESAA